VSPLERLIRDRIAKAGPMPIADYMALCLGHPEQGYYVTRDPLGARGDFTTAPEVSQLFGEMIGGWLAQVWLDAGRPAATLVELGPGRGTLMADALRVTARLPGFADSVALWLVETSPVLRATQADALGRHSPRWADRIDALPGDSTLFLVANEFFDALPVAQHLRLDQGWQERVVEIRDGRLAFGFAPARPHPALDTRFPGLSEGCLVETSPAGEAVAAEIGRRLVARGGAALVIDYGAWDGTGDTLQAVVRHGPADPLAAPGEADLTAHVRFRALAESASSAGARAHGPTGQGAFLERLGITARAHRLAAGLSGEPLDRLVAGHRRLTHPDEMGHLFQVMALTDPRAPPPPGFAGDPPALMPTR
jgi:NADH dehydrogenase [ubiquinone] 1 alpha subcomplex assembly factor 7